MGYNVLTILSVALFIACFYLYKKAIPSKISMAIFFIMALSSIFLFTAHEVANYFTGDGIDEATVYHLAYGLDGAGFLEYSELIITSLTILLLLIICLVWFVTKWKGQKNSHIIYSVLLYFFLSASLLLNPATIDIYKLQKNILAPSEQLDPKKTGPFYEHYKAPWIQETKNSSKNIVFIYAESFERTYFDETLFPDLIKGLREQELKSTYFTNIKQVAGTGWTVGGMTASQCGIPLFTPSHGNSMSGMDLFLPEAVCLGDLLESKGYNLNYMGGASLHFAGKGKLFKTHGFTTVLGRNDLLPTLENETYKTAWGLYDDSLFDLVYRRFIKLSEAGDKFGLFMLTLDTHHPSGHLSKSCKGIQYKDGLNPILNAVACSDYLISNFINKIAKSPYADNTLVVLVSDHLAMKNTAYDLLKTTKRKNLFMIIDPSQNASIKIDKIGSTLDIGSTVLPFLGYSGEIGLGRNLLNTNTLEEDTLFIHSNLRKWRQPITDFWGFPQIQKYLTINVDKKFVRIDGRDFNIPVLIELNDKLETTLKFPHGKSKKHSLVEYAKKLKSNQYFLLIQQCDILREFDKTLSKEGFCFTSGKVKKYSKIKKLESSVTYTADEIRKLLD